MRFSTTRWTTAAAAAALIAVPGAAFAQTPTQSAPTQQTTPTQQPKTTPTPQPSPTPTPTQTQQPTPTPQDPAPAQPSAEKPAAAGQVDPAAAKQHLSEARDTLSQLTSMPEAARLQGDTRTQVSQVISNFNELITTQANWRASYDKLDATLNSLIGATDQSAAAPAPAPATGVAGATGTSGTTPAAQLDPGIRAKLVEFRTHLKEFERAAGGGSADAQAATAGEPAKTTAPTMITTPPASASDPVGTSGAAAAGSTPSAMDQSKPANEQIGHAEADRELDAISAILNTSKTGTLTKAQTAQLKKHVEQLRMLLGQNK